MTLMTLNGSLLHIVHYLLIHKMKACGRKWPRLSVCHAIDLTHVVKKKSDVIYKKTTPIQFILYKSSQYL